MQGDLSRQNVSPGPTGYCVVCGRETPLVDDEVWGYYWVAEHVGMGDPERDPIYPNCPGGGLGPAAFAEVES